MYAVSEQYNDAIYAQQRTIRAQASLGSIPLSDEEDIQTLTVSRPCCTAEKLIGNAGSTRIEITLRDPEGRLAAVSEGEELTVMLGVETQNGMETVPFAPVTVDTVNTDPDSGVCTISGYDGMLHLDGYIMRSVDIPYPSTLRQIAQRLAAAAGLELSEDPFFMEDLEITQDAPPNLSGDETAREAVAWIAEAALSNAAIGRDGKLHFVSILPPESSTPSPHEIDAEAYFEFSKEVSFGPVNTLTLAREPQEDNIFRSDQDAVETQGAIELRIADNPFLDGRREDVIDTLFQKVNGLELIPYSLDWRGNPALEPGDYVTVSNTKDGILSLLYSEDTLDFDGGLRVSSSLSLPGETETDYNKASGIREVQRKTQLAVDKAAGLIEGLVYETDGLTEKTSQLEQTVDKLGLTVSTRGGSNKLTGTAAFSIEGWDTQGEITLTRSSLDTASTDSGGAFILSGRAMLSQTVRIVPGGVYCFMLRYRFSGAIRGPGVLTVSGTSYSLEDTDDWTLIQGNFTAGESQSSAEVKIENESGLLYAADLVLMEGESVSAWQQAQNEILTSSMQFANGRLTIGEDGNDVQTSVSKSGLLVSNAGKRIARFDEDGAEMGDTKIRSSLTVSAEDGNDSHALAILPQGNGHVYFVIND